MEKLELKHLAPYLPYGLKVQFIGNLEDDYKRVDSDYIQIGDVAKLGSVEFRYTNPIYWMDFKRGYFGVNSISFKPILRPLSELTKEIEHNGERFVPSKSLSCWDLDGISLIDIPHIPVNLYEILLKWHFDVFGLIDKGLAIDINKL